MAVKFPPIKRSTILMLLNLLIGIIGGNALPPLPFIGELEAPDCPPAVSSQPSGVSPESVSAPPPPAPRSPLPSEGVAPAGGASAQ